MKGGGVFLRSIGKILPHNWREKSTSDNQAAKNDDAEIKICLWDWRILSLFPKASADVLETLRRFFLGIQKRQLYLEWLCFLWETHSYEYPSWSHQHLCWRGATQVPPKQGGSSDGYGMYSQHSLPTTSAKVKTCDGITFSIELLVDLNRILNQFQSF